MESKNIYVTQPSLPPLEEFIPYLEKIWDNKWLTNNGPFHQQLEKELAEQQAQRDSDKLCEELSKAGSQYLPTKQPIDELYEAILWQYDNSSLEQEYDEYATEERERINSNYSIMSIDAYTAEHWNEADSGKTTLEKEYEEYVTAMEKALLKKQPMTLEEYALDVDWESNNQTTQELLSKLKPHYEEYMSACQDDMLQ